MLRVHEEVAHSGSQLGGLTHDDPAARGLAIVDFAIQSCVCEELGCRLEGHFLERADGVSDPNSVHCFDFSQEGDIVSDQVEVSVVDSDSVGCKEVHDLPDDGISGCFNLKV